MDIIYNIMRDNVESDGVHKVLQRLVNICAEQSATIACPRCASAAFQLASDLDAAMLRFERAVADHKANDLTTV